MQTFKTSTISTRASAASVERSHRRSGHPCAVIVVYILVTVSAVRSVVFLLALFLWAARNDGEVDRAVRAQLGR
jgi:hypothetical protein